MKRVLLALVAASLLLAACGDDGDTLGNGGNLSDDEQALADEISATIRDDDDSVPIDQADAACIGGGLVGELGFDRLIEIDFQADDVEFELSEDEADRAAGVMVECIDVQSVLADEFAEDGTISRESAECLAGKFDDDTMRQLFAAEFQGIEADQGAFIRIATQGMADCLTDEEFENFGG